MPNRILHESIKYCPKMEQLNWFEEVVYHRLTVTVDDYGCLDGRIVLLKNTLFPTREDISKDDIARAIEHMVALGLLRAYEAGGMPYLHFPAWEEEQRVRNKRRKFPAPPDAARDEEEPPAAEDSLSAADGGEFFRGEKHSTASCCQLTAGCPPESNPYPYPYPYPDSNPKFESGSVTNPYPIQAPGACAEERPRAGGTEEYEENDCGEACGGAAGNRASTPPSPREDGQSLRRGCAAPPPFAQGRLLASAASCDCATSPKAPLYTREAIDGAIPENSACSSSGVPGIEKPPANASKEEYHAYLVRLQEHFAREDAAAAAERARQAAEHVPERRVPEFVRERLKQLRAQEAARRARERAESEARYRKALAAWLGDTSAEKAECCA